jgi:hypothetical protein
MAGVHEPINDPLRRRDEVIDDSETGDPSVERASLQTRQLRGAMFQTLFGTLNGVYTMEFDHKPSEDDIREALCVRVTRDCRQFRKRGGSTELSAWHGGWTCEGIGIFSTDIWSTSRNKRARHLGRACVSVRTPTNSGSRTWNGVAY